jgi:hypothetical protein
MANNILPNFLKVDRKDNDNYIINEKFIRYILKDDNNGCFYVCSKFDGCKKDNMFQVCRNKSYETWQKLHKIFE